MLPIGSWDNDFRSNQSHDVWHYLVFMCFILHRKTFSRKTLNRFELVPCIFSQKASTGKFCPTKEGFQRFRVINAFIWNWVSIRNVKLYVLHMLQITNNKFLHLLSNCLQQTNKQTNSFEWPVVRCRERKATIPSWIQF